MKKIDFLDVVADAMSLFLCIMVFININKATKPVDGWFSLNSSFSWKLLILTICLIAVSYCVETADKDANLINCASCILTALGCYFLLVTLAKFAINVDYDSHVTWYISSQALVSMFIGRKK